MRIPNTQTMGGIKVKEDKSIMARGPRPMLIIYDREVKKALEGLEKIRKRFRLIEEEKQRAREVNRSEKGRKRTITPMHFHPVISIWGERGSGKTTVLLSIIEKIITEEEYRQDFVLWPILDPHRFSQKDRLILWMLTALKPYIDELSFSNRDLSPPYDFCRQDFQYSCPLWRQGIISHGSCPMEGNLKYCYQNLITNARRAFTETRNEKEGTIKDLLRQFYVSEGYLFPEHLEHFITCFTESWKKKMGASGEGPPSSLSPLTTPIWFPST